MATIAFKKYTDLNKVTTVTDSYLFAVHTGEELVAITTANLKTALGIAGAGGDISTLKSYFQNGVLKTANGGTGSSTVDAAPSENSDNMVKSGGVYTALAGKQDVLQFDSTPATGSSNPVTSAGIFAALGGKVDNSTFNSHNTDTTKHLTSAEHTKLTGIEEGAQVNTVTGVKGSAEESYRTGQINITKANIGLGNVDNTADANKSVSSALTATTATKVGQKLKVGSKEYDGSSEVTITGEDLGITGAMVLRGKSSTEITDGATTNPITLDTGDSLTAVTGDVVLYGEYEFVWLGTKWEKLGGDGSYVLTTDSRLSDARTPTAHQHGAISNTGTLATGDRIVITDQTGAITTGSIDPSNLVVSSTLTSHTTDTVAHITATERSTWNGKQNALTFDDAPTQNSVNPVKSGGIYSAISALSARIEAIETALNNKTIVLAD